MKDLTDKFYSLSESLNDDYWLILKFMLKHTHTKHKQGKLYGYIENACYEKIETEIEEALAKIHLVKDFLSVPRQSTIFDFMEN